MRIALANLQRDYGGAEIHVGMLADGLRQRGHDVRLWSHPEGRLGQEATRSGVLTAFLRVRSQLSPVTALRWAALLRRERPDVLHLHTPKDYWCGVLAARLARVPAVALTRHMLLPLKPLMRRVYMRADAVVCLSQGMRDLLSAEGLPPEKLALIYGAIDTTRFDTPPDAEAVCRLRCEWLAGLDMPLVGCIARLAAGKGQSALLEAVTRCEKQETPVTLVLVGDGPERAALEAETSRLGIASRVRFAGFRSDIPFALAAFDIVVMPSTNLELMPLALLEAMAASRPVIAANIGGVSEIVTNDGLGRLVPANTPEALAQALRELACDEAQRSALGTAGAAWVRERFALPRLLEETEALYARLLANSTKSQTM